MKIRSIILFILILSVTVMGTVTAQERLASVASNPRVREAETAVPFKTLQNDTLRLPVIDDFSASFPLPDPAIWTDRKAYINNSFALNPPTYGVATLDAIDSTGKVYVDATVESFLADALTSRPIDLFLPLDTTTYLSFFYQPQGLGDAPEIRDSLVVEFYAPAFRKWYRAWSVAGSASKEFTIAMINITDSKFLQKGFRFRFRNYASMAPSYEASLKVNADHWNIDYVYLSNGRTYDDVVMKDVALFRSVGSLLLNYTAMPWEHFREIGINAVKAIFQINMNSLSAERQDFTPKLRIAPVWSSGTAFEKSFTPDVIKSFERLSYDASFNYAFPGDDQDSALFEITLDLNLKTADRIPGNDRVVSYQRFADYYAYDDGSAEAGYGIVGEGAKNARLAYRFQNLNPGDSLQAVDYYFNRSLNDANRKYFRVAIWADDNNQPGELIYMQEDAIPVFTGIDSFQRIMLDTAQVVPSTYYIGWKQVTADFLNVGFDRQNNHGQDIFYNVSGTWQPTSFEGSLMMRPVFANKSRKMGIENPGVNAGLPAAARIYPNPASDFISIDCGSQAGIIRTVMTDLQGRVVKSELQAGPVCKVGVSDLPNGIYLILVTSDAGTQARQKLMVVHE